MGNGSAKQANADVASVIVNNEPINEHNDEMKLYMRIIAVCIVLLVIGKFFKHYNRVRSTTRKPAFTIGQV